MDAMQLGKLTGQIISSKHFTPKEKDNLLKLVIVWDYVLKWQRKRRLRLWLRQWLRRS